jgi:hypothetical protein
MIAIATAILPASIACAAAIDSRLTGRLDPETAAAVGAIVDTARSKGLPTDPLVARALEGASRHAPGPRIVAAVSGLSEALEASREALGPASSDAELIAGATALAAGVSADTLVSLRTARRKASLLVPLVVLTDLVTRGVPVETASSAVVAASRTRARDADLMRLRQRIDQDIRAGAPPGSATIQRTRKLIGSLQGSIAPQVSPGRPPSPGP